MSSSLPIRSTALRAMGLVAAAGLITQPQLNAQSSMPGQVRTLAGPIEAGSGGLEVDAQGNVYTADFGATLSSGPPGTRVWRITPDGEVSVYAEGFRGASGNAIGPDGTFYQANIAGGTVSKVDADGNVTPFVTSGLTAPVGMTFDGNGRLIVANCGSNTISQIDEAGVAEVFASDDLLQCPNGLVLGGDGNFYVSNFYNGDVVRVTPAGEVTRFVTLPGDNNGHLVFTDGVFYVAARAANQIWEVTMDGASRLIAGSGERGVEDGPALEATLSLPNDLALSPDGATLYWNDVAAPGPETQTLTPTVVRALTLPPRS